METLVPEDASKSKDEVEGQDDNDEVCVHTNRRTTLLLLMGAPSFALSSAAGGSLTPPGGLRFSYLLGHDECLSSGLKALNYPMNTSATPVAVALFICCPGVVWRRPRPALPAAAGVCLLSLLPALYGRLHT